MGHGKRKNVIVTYFSSVSWIGLWANIIASKKLLLIIVALHERFYVNLSGYLKTLNFFQLTWQPQIVGSSKSTKNL